MPLAKDLMGAGFPAGQALGFSGGVQSTVTAAGSSITDATDLTASINVVTTATVGQGVQVPAMNIGEDVWILNLGSGAIKVYPGASTETVNQLSAGTGFILPQYSAVMVKKVTSTRLVAILSA